MWTTEHSIETAGARDGVISQADLAKEIDQDKVGELVDAIYAAPLMTAAAVWSRRHSRHPACSGRSQGLVAGSTATWM